MGFDFEIQYKTRKLNCVADALSRRPRLIECATLVTPHWQDWDKLKTEVEANQFLECIRKDLSQSSHS